MRFPGHRCWSLGHVLVVWLIACLHAVLATNQTVSSSDSRIQYSSSDDWRDQYNGRYKVSAHDFASATFTFTGSAVYFISSINWNGARAAIHIDGQDSGTIDQSQGTQKGDPTIPSTILYGHEGLDGTKTHTMQVSWTDKGIYGGGYLSLYGFIYDDAPVIVAIPAAGSSTDIIASQTSVASINNVPVHTTSSTTGTSTTTTISEPPSSSSTGPVSTISAIAGDTSANNAKTTSHSFTQSSTGTPSKGITVTAISPSIISVSVTSFQSGSNISAPTVAAASKPGSNTAVIAGAVGGAIGGILIGVLLVFCCLWSRKRRLSSRELKDIKGAISSPPADLESATTDGNYNTMPVMSQVLNLEPQMSTDNLLPSGSGPGKIAAAARAWLLATRNMDSQPISPSTSSSGAISLAPPMFIAGDQSNVPRSGFRPLPDIAPPIYTERPS